MDHPLVTALTITVIGMILLFLALVFFYGLMSLMMSVLHRHEAGEDTPDESPSSASDAIVKQAAAIAVALARAESEQEVAARSVLAPTRGDVVPALSQWWTLHHQRQMASPPSARRSR